MQGYKTVTGIILAFAIGVGNIVDVQAAENLPEWINLLLMIIASGFALYGRIVAKGPLIEKGMKS